MKKIKKSARERFFFSLLLFFFLSTIVIIADEFKLQLFPYIDTVYTNNIFWDSTQITDKIISPGMEIDYNSGNLNFYLNANGNFYSENSYLNSYSFNSGIEFYKSLGGRDLLYITPDISINSFNNEFSYLNNISEKITIGLKKYLTKSFLLKLGFKGVNKNYSTYDSYDHLKFSSFFQLNKFFKTQTTLRAQIGLSYLYFPHIYESSEYIEYYNEPRGRRGKQQLQWNIIENYYKLSLPIINSTVRIAQSMGTQTGLILEYNYRKKLISPENMPDMEEDEWILTKMNDDFFWDGSRFSLALKTTVFLKTIIAAEISYFSKSYDGIYIKDLVGEVILPAEFRKDNMFQGVMSITKNLGKFNFYLKTIFRKNESNDSFFNYNLFTFMGGIDYNF